MAGPWERFQPVPAPVVQLPELNIQEEPAEPVAGPWARFAGQASAEPELPLPPPAPPQPLGAGQSILQGLTDPIQGGAQLLTNALPEGAVNAVNDATAWVNRQPVVGPLTRALGMVPATREDINRQTVAREDTYQARRGAGGETGIDWGRLGGGLAASVPAAIALPTGGTLLGAAGLGAVTGAGMEALQPVTNPSADYWDQKTQQATTGAQFGAAGGVIGNLAGRLLAPNVSPEARALRDAGVSLTPGQMAGGAVQRMEDRLAGLPLTGDIIGGARREGLGSFNVATANRVLEPLGQRVPTGTAPGRGLAEHLQRTIGQAYDNALATVRPFGPDQQFAQDIQTIGSQFLTPSSRQAFINFLQDNVVSRFQGGPMDGRTYQTIKSEIGRAATDYLSSSTAAERELGRALRNVQGAMETLISRANPQAAPALQAADASYAALMRFTDATGRTGALDGVFSPAHLNSAVRFGDRSLNHRAYARGDALMQDLSDAGRAVLPSQVPDSGTAGRAVAAGLAGGGLAGMLNPAVAGTAAGATALYSEPGRRLLASILMSDRPYAAQLAARLIRPSGGAISAPLAAALLSGDNPPPVAPLRP